MRRDSRIVWSLALETKTKLSALALIAVLSAAGTLAACADTSGPYGPYADVDYGGFYDGYYGDYYAGYWGPGGYFYYSDAAGHRFHRDAAGHFSHNGGAGYHAIQGHAPTAGAHGGGAAGRGDRH